MSLFGRKKLIFLYIFLLILSLIFLTYSKNTSSKSLLKEEEISKYKLASNCGKYSGINRGELARCVKENLEKSVTEIGYVKTAIDLEKSVEIYPEINTICHPYAHFIGKGAFVETKSIKESLFTATSFCEWGYLHGLNIEASNEFKGEELYNKLIEGCLYLKELKGNYYECAHGMGDAFLSSTKNLEEAFKLCDLISDEGIHLNCSQGAANYWADYIVKKVMNKDKLTKDESTYISGEPYKKCEEVKNPIDRDGCFDYAVRLNQVYVGGVEKFIPLCKKHLGVDLNSCYKGIGRELAYHQGKSIEMVVELCKEANDFNAISSCIEVLITSRTQMFMDKDGKVLNAVCVERNLSDKGVEEGCRKAREGLQKFFNGEFNL